MKFRTTLGAYAYERAKSILKESKVSVVDEEKFLENLVKEIYKYFAYDENTAVELNNIFNEVYDEYVKTTKEEVYLLKTSYSWGGEESDRPYALEEDAWKEAKELAINEAERYSTQNECEVGLKFVKETKRIILHYCDKDEYCFFDVVKF